MKKTLLQKLLHFARVLCGIEAPEGARVLCQEGRAASEVPMIADGVTPAQLAEALAPGRSYPNGGTFIDRRKFRCGDPACPNCRRANGNHQVLRSYGQWLN